MEPSDNDYVEVTSMITEKNGLSLSLTGVSKHSGSCLNCVIWQWYSDVFATQCSSLSGYLLLTYSQDIVIVHCMFVIPGQCSSSC